MAKERNRSLDLMRIVCMLMIVGLHSCLAVPYIFICSICIFTVCCIIEWIRKFLFDKLKINFVVNKICDKIQEVCSKKLLSID